MAKTYKLVSSKSHGNYFVIKGGQIQPVVKKIHIIHEGKVVFSNSMGWLTTNETTCTKVKALLDIELVSKRNRDEETIANAKRSFFCMEQVFILSTDLPDFKINPEVSRETKYFEHAVQQSINFTTEVLSYNCESLGTETATFLSDIEQRETNKSKALIQTAKSLSELSTLEVTPAIALKLINKKDKVAEILNEVVANLSVVPNPNP